MNHEELRKLVESSRPKIKAVPTPEWPEVDGHIYVRSFNIAQRDAYLNAVKDNGAGRDPDAPLKLAAIATCDEGGESLFTVDDLEWLRTKDAAALERIYLAAGEVNGFSKKVRDEIKNVLASVTT